MLSVFITPCTKPTRIQCATIRAVRSQTCREPLGAQRLGESIGRAVPRPGNELGKVALDGEVDEPRQQRHSPRDAGSSKLPKRMNDGATRQTIAPGSGSGLPS